MTWRFAAALALSTGCGPGARGEMHEPAVDLTTTGTGPMESPPGRLSYGRFWWGDDVQVRCRDADRDGHGDPDLCVIHAEAAGWIRTDSPDDCDDTDPKIHPEAGDTPGDGIDSDCTGEDACGEVIYGDVEFAGKGTELEMAEFCAGGPIEVRGEVELWAFPGGDLERLGCVCFAESLDIQSSDGLADLSGLASLCSIGALSVAGNTSMASLDGLCPPEGHLEFIKVRSNRSLVDLHGLERVTSVGAIDLSTELSSLRGLDGLLSVERDLRLSASDVRDLEPLANLTSIGGELKLQTASLETLAGLESLVSLGRLAIWAPVPDLRGLESIATLESLSLSEIAATSLAGLDGLAEVTGEVDIQSNPNLETLDGLDALVRVDSRLRIDMNPLLQDLDGFTSLRGVGGDLSIQANDSLVDIGALANLEYIDGDLLVGENPALSTEHVEAVVEAIGLENINGDVWIWENAP